MSYCSGPSWDHGSNHITVTMIFRCKYADNLHNLREVLCDGDAARKRAMEAHPAKGAHLEDGGSLPAITTAGDRPTLGSRCASVRRSHGGS